MGRRKLDVDKMAGYMSPQTANAVFGQRLSDNPAYVANPVSHNGRFGRFGPTYAEAKEALKKRYEDDAWNELHEAETFEQQQHAVMALSDMVFGDNEVGRFVDALRGDIAKMAAETATPPAILLGELVTNVKFYGVATDPGEYPPGEMTATLEPGP